MLHRDRVSESLWKPHKSKVLNFLHRNYTSIFFPTPKKKQKNIGQQKKTLKKKFEKKSPEDFLKIENVDQEKNNWSKFSIFRKSFSVKTIFYFIFFVVRKKYFVSELEKQIKYSFDVKNWELSIYEVFRAIPTLYRDVGANIWHQKFKNRVNSAPGPLADLPKSIENQAIPHKNNF